MSDPEAQAVRDTAEMIRGMNPERVPGRFVFATSDAPDLIASAIASFREDEGLSLILPEHIAAAHGLDTSLPMACLTLQINSALDGIGLTAAVAGTLAKAGIPCNMVAAHHHDHAFVPADTADAAQALLIELANAT